MTTYRETAIKRIRSKMFRAGLDALLLTGRGDIEYLSGYYTAGAMIVITRKGRPVFIVDAMNRAFAERSCRGTVFDVAPVSGSVSGTFARCVKENLVKKIGINTEALSAALFARISKLAPKVKFLPSVGGAPTGRIMEEIRQIKFPAEIRILRVAAKETIRIWRDVRKNLVTGMSERDIADMVDICVRSRGYRNSFSTIVAAGKNTAFPHAVPARKLLLDGEHLLVDMGIRFRGYCSDLTRIYDNGRINGQIRAFHRSVLKARDFALKKIGPGVLIGSLVEDINGLFKKDGFGDFILHGLGHGVGIDVHERPFLRAGSRERLKKGMVITVEPGLYKPGTGGVREEEMVLVTAKGCEVLTG